MDTLTTRESLEAAFRRRIKKFHVEPLDADVFLRPLSGAARAQIGDAFESLPKEGPGRQAPLMREVSARAVAFGLVTEDGTRLYADDDLDVIIQEFEAQVLDLIATEISRISGMSAVPKNSPGGQTSEPAAALPEPSES
jgi:hypothetical protein